MAFRLEHNVGGVPGFSIAYEVFTEALERKLFDMCGPVSPPSPAHKRKEKEIKTKMSESFPPIIYEVLNAVRDCGLCPTFVTPDYLLMLSYEPGAIFMHHLDSKSRWGDCIVGVSIGSPCNFYLQPVGGAAVAPRVNVDMPRRSLYVLSGASRTEWRHGVNRVGGGVGAALAPSWNPQRTRRSLTLRASKTFNVTSLRRELSALGPTGNAAAAAALQSRIDHELENTEQENKDWLATAVVEATWRLDSMQRASATVASRLRAEEVSFLGSVPAAVRALYRSAGSAPGGGGAHHRGADRAEHARFSSPGAGGRTYDGGGGEGGGGAAMAFAGEMEDANIRTAIAASLSQAQAPPASGSSWQPRRQRGGRADADDSTDEAELAFALAQSARDPRKRPRRNEAEEAVAASGVAVRRGGGGGGRGGPEVISLDSSDSEERAEDIEGGGDDGSQVSSGHKTASPLPPAQAPLAPARVLSPEELRAARLKALGL